MAALTTYHQFPVILLFLLSLNARLCLAVPTTQDGWEDWTNNLISDIAPLVALFGEQVTKQYLSESTSFLDCVVFGFAPLGIITAIVSAIRVAAPPSLRAFVGRAQEPHGLAESELCSSTSKDVCELWSNEGGICRVFGRPNILEFFYVEDKNDFVPEFRMAEGQSSQSVLRNDVLVPPFSRLFGSKELLCGCNECKPKSLRDEQPQANRTLHEKFYDARSPTTSSSSFQSHSNAKSKWHEDTPTIQCPTNKYTRLEGDREADVHRFGDQPNLTLNIGITTTWGKQRRHLWLTLLVGIIVTVALCGFAFLLAFNKPHMYDDGESPHVSIFWIFIGGTVVMSVGMVMCAALIEETSDERRFKSAAKGPAVRTFWLQAGGQRIGDQLFNAFAYNQMKTDYATSWRGSFTGSVVRRRRWLLILATVLSIAGFIFQFIGLRRLHPTLILVHMGTILLMSALRAMLRSKRLGPDANRLAGLPDSRILDTHELDWQALHIEDTHSPDTLGCPNASQPRWYIYLRCSTPSAQQPSRFSTRDTTAEGLEVQWEYLSHSNQTPVLWAKSHGVVISAMLEKTTDQPLDASAQFLNLVSPPQFLSQRVFAYRSRLSVLAKSGLDPGAGTAWNSDVYAMALKLKDAIQRTTKYVLSGAMGKSIALHASGGRDDGGDLSRVGVFVWSVPCGLTGGKEQEVAERAQIVMNFQRGNWHVSGHDLAALLGLWSWHLKHESPTFDRKNFLDSDDMFCWMSNPIRSRMPPTTTRCSGAQSSNINKCPGDCSRVTSARLSIALTHLLSYEELQDCCATVSSIPTKDDILQLLAQDIFTIFLSQLVQPIPQIRNHVQRRLDEVAMSRRRESRREDLSHQVPCLQNSHVEAIASDLVSAGVASMDNAIVSTASGLLSAGKLQTVTDSIPRLLAEARELRRQKNLFLSEDLLVSLCRIVSDRTSTVTFAVRAAVWDNTADFYHRAIRGSENAMERRTWTESFDKLRKQWPMPDSVDRVFRYSTYLFSSNMEDDIDLKIESSTKEMPFRAVVDHWERVKPSKDELREFLTRILQQTATGRDFDPTIFIEYVADQNIDIVTQHLWNCKVEELTPRSLTHLLDCTGVRMGEKYELNSEDEKAWPAFGRAALFKCIANGRKDLVGILLLFGVPTAPSRDGDPFALAAKDGRAEILHKLMEEQPYCRADAKSLDELVEDRNLVGIQDLLSVGMDRNGVSALALAIARDDNILHALLADPRPANPNRPCVNDKPLTPLELAVILDKTNAINMLIHSHAEITDQLVPALLCNMSLLHPDESKFKLLSFFLSERDRTKASWIDDDTRRQVLCREALRWGVLRIVTEMLDHYPESIGAGVCEAPLLYWVAEHPLGKADSMDPKLRAVGVDIVGTAKLLMSHGCDPEAKMPESGERLWQKAQKTFKSSRNHPVPLVMTRMQSHLPLHSLQISPWEWQNVEEWLEYLGLVPQQRQIYSGKTLYEIRQEDRRMERPRLVR